MSRRTSRNDAGMDLFPFMAVLICTVGALIMLLVVMVPLVVMVMDLVRVNQAAVKVVKETEKVLAMAVLFVVLNLCIDVLYTIIDPRTRGT